MELSGNTSLHSTESKEIPERMSVGIELKKAGGFGDILHLAKVAMSLGESNLNVQVFSNRVTDRYLDICSEELSLSTVVHESDQHNDPDILITSITPTTEKKAKKAHIHIEEFSYREGWEATDADYIISTGLGFNPEDYDKIQAGITDSETLKRKMLDRERVRIATRHKLNEILANVGIQDKVDLDNAHIGLVYTSSLTTNYKYISELSAQADGVKSPVVVFCIGSSAHGYEMGFDERDPKGRPLREILKDSNVSYYNATDSEDLQFDKRNQSKVTVVNLGRTVPHSFFEDLLLTVNFPSVVTGDQSLAEAIQVSSTFIDSPPFLYFCLTGHKPLHLIDTLSHTDSVAASLAANYLLGEHFADYVEYLIPYIQKYTQENDTKFGSIFTNQEIQDRYVKAFSAIPKIILQEKQKYVPYAEKLVWESDTVKFVIDSIKNGKPELLDFLKPKRTAVKE